jgi:putative ABC transport system substrate-binding protein
MRSDRKVKMATIKVTDDNFYIDHVAVRSSIHEPRRRRFLTITLVLAAAVTIAPARSANKPFRVGFLTASPDERFQQSLKELGYVEGRDVIIEMRDIEGKYELLDKMALDLVRMKVDVIVAAFPAAVLSAKRATATIPIVMVNTPDPVQLGLVSSLARPGGNITGMSTLSVDISIKQLELLREAIPRLQRVALLWNSDNPWHGVAVRDVKTRSATLGTQLQVVEAHGADTFESAFRAMAAERAQAVLILADPMFFAYRQRLSELALQHRLPAMGNVLGFTETGSLMSYWADRSELARRAASYVDRILKGAKPAELPIEQPTMFEFVINLKTARKLGITIPQAVLVRANRLID